MDENCDIFAKLNDYCANFTPDNIPYPVNSENNNQEESSDSEAEKFFTKAKKRAATKEPANSELLPSKKRTRKKPTSDPEYNGDVSNVSTTRRTRRKRGGETATTSAPTSTIEKYMQQRTAAVLAVENLEVARASQRGRARRRYMATRANRASVTAVVDLAGPKTPPLPPRSDLNKVKAVISLDSDDEEDSFDLSAVRGIQNSSFDFENAELCVKIKWGDKIDSVPHRKHQKFIDLMKRFADEKGVEYQDILLDLNERIIEPNDTPDSIGYRITQFIQGRVVVGGHAPAPKKKDPNMIKVKIQSNKFKKPLKVPIRKDQPFKILYIKCSEELKISCDRIKLSFDGDRLILSETPTDLDLEGGELIDCTID